MKFNAPTKAIFYISLIIAIIAILVKLAVPTFSANAIWVAIVAYIVLACGCVMKGL